MPSPILRRRAAMALLPIAGAKGVALANNTSEASAQAAQPAQLAVASSLALPVQALAAAFSALVSPAKIGFSFGATAKLYAQIKSGAPFNALLAADQTVPAALERDGLSVAGSRFTYASGRLALWAANPTLISGDGARSLREQRFRKLALAAPAVAPYGAAAEQALRALGLWEALGGKLVIAESVGQAHHFVHTGAAELGFVATAQVFFDGRLRAGSAWIVPPTLHAPIQHDAVLLKRAQGQGTARAFLRFLAAPPAQTVLRQHGYQL